MHTNVGDCPPAHLTLRGFGATSFCFQEIEYMNVPSMGTLHIMLFLDNCELGADRGPGSENLASPERLRPVAFQRLLRLGDDLAGINMSCRTKGKKQVSASWVSFSTQQLATSRSKGGAVARPTLKGPTCKPPFARVATATGGHCS